ncbi:MAG: GTP-binding protein [Candidatus Thorarchaeota archaeon]|nr:GTP-binding protein [Candidatus Thorarchaeota archaeon]
MDSKPVRNMPSSRRSVQYVKVVFVGPGGAGKSTIARRLITGGFVNTDMTVGMDVESWSLLDTSKNVTLGVSISDLGGQNQFRFFQPGLIRGAKAAVLVVDLERFDTVISLDEWLAMLESIPRNRWILVGNKVDRATECACEEVAKKAEDLTIRYVIISAKEGTNFEALEAELTSIITSATLEQRHAQVEAASKQCE